MKSSPMTQMPIWQRAAVITGIALGYLGVAVFGVAALFEFINTSTIILGLLLIGAGVVIAHIAAIIRVVKRA